MTRLTAEAVRDALRDVYDPCCADRGISIVDMGVVEDVRVAGGHVEVDLVLTTGGTGLAARDVTPEATRVVIEREAPGLAEVLRADGLRHTPRAVLSRGIAGTRANALIVNLPGSTAGVRDGLATLDPLVEHIAALLAGHTGH